MFNTMGCPVGLYLMGDLCEGRVPDSARLYVFLNAYRVTAEQRRPLRAQVARDGKVALWLYAPGFIDEDASAGNSADLIGFRVAPLAEPTTSRVRLVAGAPAPLSDLPAEHSFGVDFRPSPLFAVEPGQPEVVALGNYEGTQQVALAMRRTEDWSSVFCGGLQVSAEVLRELARAAGAHLYCESNEVISGCPGFISVHATAPGPKTLIFPEAVRLRELFSGQVLEPPAVRHSFELEAGETRLFSYQAG